MPINDDELHAFIDETQEEEFANALVKVHAILKTSFGDEDAALLARDYWNWLLDNAEITFEMALDAEGAQSEDRAPVEDDYVGD